MIYPCIYTTDSKGQRCYTPLFHPVNCAALEAHRPGIDSAATGQRLLSRRLDECLFSILGDDLGRCIRCMHTTVCVYWVTDSHVASTTPQRHNDMYTLDRNKRTAMLIVQHITCQPESRPDAVGPWPSGWPGCQRRCPAESKCHLRG